MKALFIESVFFHHGCHIQPLALPKSDKLFFRAAIEAVAVSQLVLIHSVRLFVVSLALCLMAAAFGFHFTLPPCSRVNTLRACHLSRGLVERALVRLGGACLHPLSVA